VPAYCEIKGNVTSSVGIKTNLSFYNNLQPKVDNGFRAAHVVSLAGKAITEHFYASRLQKAYFMGCSVGGGARHWLRLSVFRGTSTVSLPARRQLIRPWSVQISRGQVGRSTIAKGIRCWESTIYSS
jgi:Tannase and feruloyl esterase